MAVENEAIGKDALNVTGPWCWVKTDSREQDVFWMIIAGKGWEIACYLITTCLYVLLKVYLVRLTTVYITPDKIGYQRTSYLALPQKSNKNICCGYSLEATQLGAPYEYHNTGFGGEI